MSELEKARQIINETDKKMAELFEKRMDAVKTVAEYKKAHGLPIDDFQREKVILERGNEIIKNQDYKAYYNDFLKNNIAISKAMQHRLLDGMRVSYSGVEGSFAQNAALKIFPDAKTVSCDDFKTAYESVVNSKSDCAVLPIENSFNGDVGAVLDLVFFGPLYINGIYEAEIIQNLMGIKGTRISDVKTVISHPQALGQCADFIRQYNMSTVQSANTALAAKEVSKKNDKSFAAIASREAAKEFGLEILAPHINESNTNTTRFVVFSKNPKFKSGLDEQFVMLFTVDNTAGALGKAVSVIGDYGFNLRALKSRPTKQLSWSYYFYAEGEGNIYSENGQKMLNKLKECCTDIKIAGSFEKEIKI